MNRIITVWTYCSLVLCILVLEKQQYRKQWHLSKKQYISVIKEFLRLSSFELVFVHCESGALSTEPLPRGLLTSCCAQYLCRPDSALQIALLNSLHQSPKISTCIQSQCEKISCSGLQCALVYHSEEVYTLHLGLVTYIQIPTLSVSQYLHFGTQQSVRYSVLTLLFNR